MTSRNRSLIFAAIIGLLAVGWVYTKVLVPWRAQQEESASVPVATKKKTIRPKPKKTEPAIPQPQTPPPTVQTPPPAAPDPNAFGYRGLLFDRFDQNADRYLDREELPPRYTDPMFAQDKDGNGKIDVVEFQAAIDAGALVPDREVVEMPRQVLLTPPAAGEEIPVYVPQTQQPEPLPDWFRARDKDGDGQLGLYEWPAGSIAEFERYDANKDGFVTAAEVEQSARDARRESPTNSKNAGSSRPSEKDRP